MITTLAIFSSIAAVLASAAPAAAAPPQDQAPIEYRGFVLSSGRCLPSQVRCDLQGPKDWAPQEVAAIKRAIDEIMSRPGGKRIAERAQTRNAFDLRRFEGSVGRDRVLNADTLAARTVTFAWAGIEFYDSGLTNLDARDQYSGKPGYLLLAAVLLHECFHAIDEWSQLPEFAKVAGFRSAGERWRFAANDSDFAILARYREAVRGRRAGDFGGEWALGREIALSMRPIRVPTARATDNPQEAFATDGTHLILDPRARKYLPPALVAYFDENVFIPATAK